MVDTRVAPSQITLVDASVGLNENVATRRVQQSNWRARTPKWKNREFSLTWMALAAKLRLSRWEQKNNTWRPSQASEVSQKSLGYCEISYRTVSVWICGHEEIHQLGNATTMGAEVLEMVVQHTSKSWTGSCWTTTERCTRPEKPPSSCLDGPSVWNCGTKVKNAIANWWCNTPEIHHQHVEWPWVRSCFHQGEKHRSIEIKHTWNLPSLHLSNEAKTARNRTGAKWWCNTSKSWTATHLMEWDLKTWVRCCCHWGEKCGSKWCNTPGDHGCGVAGNGDATHLQETDTILSGHGCRVANTRIKTWERNGDATNEQSVSKTQDAARSGNDNEEQGLKWLIHASHRPKLHWLMHVSHRHGLNESVATKRVQENNLRVRDTTVNPRIRLNLTGLDYKVAAVQVRAKEQHQDLHKQAKCLKSLQEIARTVVAPSWSESVVTKKSINLETRQPWVRRCWKWWYNTPPRTEQGVAGSKEDNNWKVHKTWKTTKILVFGS